MCIFDCQAGAGYRTNLATCSSCPKGQYNRKEGRNSNTCKLCPAGTTNYQSGSTSCAFNISPIPDNHINLRFVGKVEVAINECTDTDSINGITNQVEQTARKVFQDRTNALYNSEQRFCHGDSCDNLDASQNPTCEVITRLKRAITHRLTISFVFYNIRFVILFQKYLRTYHCF
ncbi:uncharacterized protein LOC132752705 [Ruditapes philippinarum]|uniref:uncharacterized protein LOC132752705 n=1 Tax=Ruditapes philippinarum TaxID=129788 RepID=UPI00295A8D8E|nr:uncharacterized protein LOC132752705 [Ruditapes philippinarum]